MKSSVLAAGVVAVLTFSTASCSLSNGSVSGESVNDGVYDSVYAAFVTEFKSGANWALINGVTYESQCRTYWSMEVLTRNFSENDESEYLRACVDAHRGVFGTE
jgi:hypothetical protein